MFLRIPSVSYGIRYEYVRLSVDDFIVGNTYDNAGKAVEGGTPSFDEFLFNVGITHYLTDDHQVVCVIRSRYVN